MKTTTGLYRTHYRDNFGLLEDAVIVRCVSKDHPDIYFKQLTVVLNWKDLLKCARALRRDFKKYLDSLYPIQPNSELPPE